MGVSSIINPKEPKGVFRKVADFSERDLRQMFSIYEKYYENTRFELFERDFKKKTGAILILHPKTGRIVGFSTILDSHIKVGGKVRHAFFSGDTVIEKEFWGSRALQIAMYKYLLKFKARYPFDPVYWMLISKGFKTYLLLANNYYSYWPHPKGKSSRLKPIVDAYCEQYFEEYFDHKTGLLDFGDDYQPLKGEVAPITQQMLDKNPKISFFVEKNPSWERGTELPCIGEIVWKDIFRYVQRFATKNMSVGKSDARESRKIKHA